MTTFLVSLFTHLLDLLLPQHCAGCPSPTAGRSASSLHSAPEPPHLAPGLPPVAAGSPSAAPGHRPSHRGPLCDVCQAILARPPTIAWHPPRPTALPPPWSVADYAGPVRTMLIAYKERGRTALAKPLGAALAHSVHTALRAHGSKPGGSTARRPGPSAQPFRLKNAGIRADRAHRPGGAREHTEVLVIPVPSAPRAVRRRGHDAVRGLAEAAVRRLRAEGVPVSCEAALRQRRAVADQSGLGAGGRTANLSGALHVPAPRRVCGRQVVVVDDVITSGATLCEAARALTAAGAQVIGVATVAATPRRHH